jgi:hypothetical protein
MPPPVALAGEPRAHRQDRRKASQEAIARSWSGALRTRHDRDGPCMGERTAVQIVTRGNQRGRALSGLRTPMRPTRDLRSLAAPLALVLAACAETPTGDARSPAAIDAPTVDIVVGDPIAEPPAPPAPTPRADRDAGVAPQASRAEGSDPEPEALPKTWSGPIVAGLSFAEALRKARAARDAQGRLVAPAAKGTAAEAARKLWFTTGQGLVDQASRMYAAAFHATDATREGRIDAIAEAAELDMTMARSLDDAGLATLPPAWRSDPAVASTFEDIAVGPTRRWRDEARVLARQCVASARESGVITEAARRCAQLRTGARLAAVRRGTDAGAPCACSPGDPLCSASLGGWCGPTSP